jgi:hypothetical protein
MTSLPNCSETLSEAVGLAVGAAGDEEAGEPDAVASEDAAGPPQADAEKAIASAAMDRLKVRAVFFIGVNPHFSVVPDAAAPVAAIPLESI